MATITKEIVEAVMKYNKKYPQMTMKELSALCGIAQSSVSNILNGMYNNLLEEKSSDTKSIKSEIPYEAYRRLVTCELAIEELINSSIKSKSEDEALFISFKFFDSLIKRYFPEEYQKKIDELYKENIDDYED